MDTRDGCSTGSQSGGGTQAAYAVLLMAYGGPRSLDEVEPFLLDIRKGRPVAPELLAEVRKRYAHIGGSSPLPRITAEQAEALERILNIPHEGSLSASPRFRVFVGMKHWTPRIADAVEAIAVRGFRKLIALCMSPVYSRMTVGEYHERLYAAHRQWGAEVEIHTVDHWHTNPWYIEAIVEQIHRGWEYFPPSSHGVTLLFTAHSIPAAVVEAGDPYDSQLREIVDLVIRRLGQNTTGSPPVESWSFCYQSAGARAVEWLGPSLEAAMHRLAQEGKSNVLVVPIGFLCDHVEILYDIDVDGRHLAEHLGLHMERVPSLNTSPTLIKALADTVQKACARMGEMGKEQG